MFSKATAKFVRQIDPEGSLIHVSRVNDSHKLLPMALVVKRNHKWFWQRPKYQPTDFTLSDLLQGDKVLSPGVCETEFVTYKGTFGEKLSGKLDTKAGSVGVELEGQGTSKLQSCFGRLKKEELDVKKLLRDSSDRLVNMQHVLVQQLEKRADVLAVVKERILTTNSCSVTQTKKEQCIFQGVLGLVGMLGSSVKVCVKDSNLTEMDSDVSLEIPSGTVIAYSVLELEINKDGHFDIFLQPRTAGGFEADPRMSWPSHDSFSMVVGDFTLDPYAADTKLDVSEDDTGLMQPPSNFTPELQGESSRISYRFRCPGPGGFQCSLTGLMFVMAQEAELLYKTVQWDENVLQSAGKTPAGPLFEIQCAEDAVCQLHLPHCEIKEALLSEGLLSVVHLTDDGMSILEPLAVTDTHVIVRVPHLSSFGLVWALESLWRFWNNIKQVSGQVLLFLRPPNLKTQKQNLDVFLLSSNVPLEEVRARHRNSVHIQAPSKCKLIRDQSYSVHCQTAYKIQPEKEDFDMEFGPNYHPLFEIRLPTNIEVVTVTVRDQANKVVWEREVDLTGAPSVTADTNVPVQTPGMQMAVMGLVNILDDLRDDEFEKFKWHLKNEYAGSIPPIKVSQLSKAERRDTVDLMLQKYEFVGTMGVIKRVLTKISRNDLVKQLPTVSSGTKGSQEMDLSPLAELPGLTRDALSRKLQETMRDRSALSYLECVLEELCYVDQLSSDSHTECRESSIVSHLKAVHLLVSAMEELPDETLRLLSESRADFLEAFDTLLCRLKVSSGPVSIQCLPVPLQEKDFQLAEQLLSSTNVTLKRNSDRLWTETQDQAGVLPLLLCLTAHGLSLLCNGLK